MSQGVGRQLGKAFRQLHDRFVRAAGEHDVLEPLQLVRDGIADARIAVTEQVYPPGADAVEKTAAAGIFKPGTVSTDNR